MDMNFQDYKNFKQQFIAAISDGDISAFAAKEEISQLSQEQLDDLQFSFLGIIVKELRENDNFDTDVSSRCSHAYGEIESLWNDVHTDKPETKEQPTETAEYPILKRFLCNEYDDYLEFCKSLKCESDKIRLLYSLLGGKPPSLYADVKDFFNDLSTDVFFMCNYNNFINYFDKTDIEKVKRKYDTFKKGKQ